MTEYYEGVKCIGCDKIFKLDSEIEEENCRQYTKYYLVCDCHREPIEEVCE